MKNNFLMRFSRRKVNYRRAVDAFYMSKGIACVCCNIRDIDDILNHYCVPGYEMLNIELADYIDRSTENIPVGVPVAIEFCGCRFSEQEKKKIRDAVWNHYEMELGKAQRNRTYHLIRLCWFILFFILSAVLILSGRTGSASRELLYVAFYFLGDRMIDYIVFGNKDVEYNRIRFAQLVSMKVIFRDHFIDEELSDEEADEIRKAIAENAKSTEI